MSEQKKFGVVGWTAGDLMTLVPRFNETQATEWLAANEKYVRDRLVEAGWGVLESLLQYDGVDMLPVEFKEHDSVELTEECMGEPVGTRGTIVHVYKAGSFNPVDDDHELVAGRSYEMEVTGNGRTIMVDDEQIKQH